MKNFIDVQITTFLKLFLFMIIFIKFQATSIATLGLIFYLVYGAALLNKVVADQVLSAVPSPSPEVTYCLNMGKSIGAMSIICSFTYLLDTIWCFVALCKETK